MGHHEAGQRLEQFGDDVAAPVFVEPIEAFGDEGPYVVLEVSHLPGGEARTDQSAELRVVGRVEEHQWGGLAHVHTDTGFDGQAPCRRVGGGVAGGVEHVGEPGEYPEVVLVLPAGTGGNVVDRVVVP